MIKLKTYNILTKATLSLMVSVCLVFVLLQKNAEAGVNSRAYNDIEKHRVNSSYPVGSRLLKQKAYIKKPSAKNHQTNHQAKKITPSNDLVATINENKESYVFTTPLLKSKPDLPWLKLPIVNRVKKSRISQVVILPAKAKSKPAKVKKSLSSSYARKPYYLIAADERRKKEDENTFGEEMTVVSNEELGNIRGGVFNNEGMLTNIGLVNIGLITQTSINGEIVEQSQIDLNNINDFTPDIIQRIITSTADGVTVSSSLGINDVPQLFTTVIQNSLDDAVINNATILNIDISNATDLILQTPVPIINHQLIGSLN